jgi:hypothetical protein
MADLTKEERVAVFMLKDPRFPVAPVEGTFHGKRAIFVCSVEQGDGDAKVDLTPLAMILRDEDVPHCAMTQEGVEKEPLIKLAKE